MPWVGHSYCTGNPVVSILLKPFILERTVWCLMKMWWRSYEWRIVFHLQGHLGGLSASVSNECVPRPAGGSSVWLGKLWAWKCKFDKQMDCCWPIVQGPSCLVPTLSWRELCLEFCLWFILTLSHQVCCIFTLRMIKLWLCRVAFFVAFFFYRALLGEQVHGETTFIVILSGCLSGAWMDVTTWSLGY